MTYPLVSGTRRVVCIGGLSKAELLAGLRAAEVQLNALAQDLVSDARFVTAAAPSRIDTVEISVADAGLPDGGTFDEISRRASRLGLALCPLELAAYLRLQLSDQAEGHIGHPPSQNCAPPGSITVASQAIATDDDTPKGFYLRRIEGVLWLRGYRSWPGHIWYAEDRMVFSLLDLDGSME